MFFCSHERDNCPLSMSFAKNFAVYLWLPNVVLMNCVFLLLIALTVHLMFCSSTFFGALEFWLVTCTFFDSSLLSLTCAHLKVTCWLLNYVWLQRFLAAPSKISILFRLLLFGAIGSWSTLGWSRSMWKCRLVGSCRCFTPLKYVGCIQM